MKYQIYVITIDGLERPLVAHTSTNSRKIADTAIEDAREKLGRGLFVILIEDGKASKAFEGTR